MSQKNSKYTRSEDYSSFLVKMNRQRSKEGIDEPRKDKVKSWQRDEKRSRFSDTDTM